MNLKDDEKNTDVQFSWKHIHIIKKYKLLISENKKFSKIVKELPVNPEIVENGVIAINENNIFSVEPELFVSETTEEEKKEYPSLNSMNTL